LIVRADVTIGTAATPAMATATSIQVCRTPDDFNLGINFLFIAPAPLSIMVTGAIDIAARPLYDHFFLTIDGRIS
jgi:hypothetical protein